MVPKVDPSKFPEMLNAITENVRDSYAGMVFIDDPEDLASWGFTKEQLDELDSFAQKYGLTDVLEINEWNPDSKPDYILSTVKANMWISCSPSTNLIFPMPMP